MYSFDENFTLIYAYLRILQKEQTTDGDLLRKLSLKSIKREREKKKKRKKKKQELKGQRYDKKQNGK